MAEGSVGLLRLHSVGAASSLSFSRHFTCAGWQSLSHGGRGRERRRHDTRLSCKGVPAHNALQRLPCGADAGSSLPSAGVFQGRQRQSGGRRGRGAAAVVPGSSHHETESASSGRESLETPHPSTSSLSDSSPPLPLNASPPPLPNPPSSGSTHSAAHPTAAPGSAMPAPLHPPLPYSTLTFLACLGAAETAYLSYEKLFGGPITCAFGGSCNDVLDSPYGILLGLPLPLYGFLSYSALALLAQIARTNATRSLGLTLYRDNVRWLLLGLASLMAGVSLYLLYIIRTQLDSAFCAYCYASAALSTLILLLAFQGFSAAEVRRAVLPQAGVMAGAVLALSVAFSDVRSASAGVQDIDLPPLEPEVTTLSSPLQLRLAKHLAAAGARMYGAFWCSHCYDQKQAFGQEGAKLLPYVECYPEGYRRGAKVAQECAEAKVEGFPTWLIQGQLWPGELELEELARLSGFEGPKGPW